MHNWFIVNSVCLAGLNRRVWGKWLKSQMWSRYNNNNHPLSYASLVDATILHHDMSYDSTLQNIELNGKLNDELVYHHYATGKNTSTIH